MDTLSLQKPNNAMTSRRQTLQTGRFADHAMKATKQEFFDRMGQGAVIEVRDYEKNKLESRIEYPETLEASELTAWLSTNSLNQGVHYIDSRFGITDISSRVKIDMTGSNKTSQWMIYGGLLHDCIMVTLEYSNEGMAVLKRNNQWYPNWTRPSILASRSINDIVLPLYAINHTFTRIDAVIDRRYEGKDKTSGTIGKIFKRLVLSIPAQGIRLSW